MHILWVKMGGLWPATSGGRVRSLQIVSALARRHRVTVLTTHGADDDPDGLARQLSHCQRVVSMPMTVAKRGDTAFAANGPRIRDGGFPASVAFVVGMREFHQHAIDRRSHHG